MIFQERPQRFHAFSPTMNLQQIYCETESCFVTKWTPDGFLTQCPNDPLHSVNLESTLRLPSTLDNVVINETISSTDYVPIAKLFVRSNLKVVSIASDGADQFVFRVSFGGSVIFESGTLSQTAEHLIDLSVPSDGQLFIEGKVITNPVRIYSLASFYAI